MRKFLIVAIAVMFGLSSCRAEGKTEVVTFKDLPSAAQQIVNSFFTGKGVSAVLKETELFEVEYEVRFEDASEIVFDGEGTWKKIECRKPSVPDALVPAELLAKVQASFPLCAIVEIERDNRGYDVELDNGLDLNFDRKFRMTVDD